MQQVELAAAAPSAKESWLGDLQQSLRQLEIEFTTHVDRVQAPDGLLEGIVDTAPRLQLVVERTRENHAAVSRSIAEALEMTRSEDATHDDIREATMAVLVALARHRQKGADLIYNAYAIDIGGY
jgi:hypothetical protein